MRKEAQFQTLFRHWVKANPLVGSCAIELKQTPIEYISFSALEQHQIDFLLSAKNGGLLYKVPDDSRGVKPFDMFYLRESPAFVVIKYPDGFVLIDIETFILEKNRSKRKSLTYDRAKEICIKSVDLKSLHKK